MRKPVAKPRSEQTAKAEADRLSNLADSAQARIDAFKDEELAMLNAISALESKCLETEKKCEEAEARKASIISSISGFVEERDMVKKDISLLEEICTKKSVELENIDLLLAEKEKKSTEKTEAKLKSLEMDVQNAESLVENANTEVDLLKSEADLNRKAIEKAGGTLTEVEQATIIASGRLKGIESDVASAEARLAELRGVSEALKPAEERLTVTEGRIAGLFSEILEAEIKLAEREAEYAAFEEKTAARLEAVRKLEEAVENKTRRLKAVQDEKGISEYLSEFGIK